ncbi:serine hydrolase [Rheinheimera baltica]|uniref:Serine hydrolase n=1 Tax=Rheinheimera baltica TaxID=67576 RepID=A0ABT9I4X7_9GAMM|nr:serine hydrolase domain-containing protein [Rheinheimera baltica]MDP5138461.1 serine hydrolase [Rheinheimera baltica]MDP5149354.1 serine hydrolase [Rheinheimera baltica]
MNRLAIFIFALALSSCSAGSDYRSVSSIVQSDKAAMASLAEELQQEHKAGTFDGLVLVAQRDVVLFKSAYGYADREDSVKNSSAAIFDMGSIAKTFTAAAVLQLAQKEKLQLSDTIGDFYPTAPDEIKPITITQLLGHSSGLDNFHNESDFELMDKAQAERRILEMPLIGKPGEKIAYSNAAYTLLAAIVEKVSEQPFQDYVHDNLLTPLNLKSTGFYQDQRVSLNNLARGYGGDDQGLTTFEKGLTWALIGAGGMVTSIDDLAIWSAALKNGAMLPAGASNLAFSKANERWLLGSLAQVEISGESIIQMGGSTDYGYTALIQFVPNRNLLIVLLLNAHDNKYKNATHHRLSRNHILPILLGEGEELPNNSMQPTADASAD